jgi:DNA methyltransferase 1-associated protein 1
MPGVRSVEDLKERYYSVSRELLLMRCTTVQEQTKAKEDNVFKVTFDKAAEVARKAKFEQLFRRTLAETQEELDLYNELQALNQRQRKIEDDLKAAQKSKKKAEAAARSKERSVVLGPKASAPSSGPVASTGGGPILVEDAIEPLNFSAAPGRPALSSSLFIAPLKDVPARVLKRVDARLVELNMGLQPMPTERVTAKFEELRRLLVAQVEQQRTLERLQAEQKVKNKLVVVPGSLAALNQARAAAGAAGPAGAGAATGASQQQQPDQPQVPGARPHRNAEKRPFDAEDLLSPSWKRQKK